MGRDRTFVHLSQSLKAFGSRARLSVLAGLLAGMASMVGFSGAALAGSTPPTESGLETSSPQTAPSPATESERARWTLRASVLSISPGGDFEAVRANGKRVTSTIPSEVGIRLEAEYRLGPRLGLSISYLGGSQHDFVIHQDFPDGTDFESRDSFSYDSLTAGISIHLRRQSRVDLFFEPFVTWATYDDLALASAGPPFDRDAPFLEVKVDNAFGAGAIVGLEVPFGSSNWSFHALAGLVALPFSGEFPTQEDEPGEPPTGTLGPGFSPLIFGIGLSISL